MVQAEAQTMKPKAYICLVDYEMKENDHILMNDVARKNLGVKLDGTVLVTGLRNIVVGEEITLSTLKDINSVSKHIGQYFANHHHPINTSDTLPVLLSNSEIMQIKVLQIKIKDSISANYCIVAPGTVINYNNTKIRTNELDKINRKYQDDEQADNNHPITYHSIQHNRIITDITGTARIPTTTAYKPHELKRKYEDDDELEFVFPPSKKQKTL